MRYAMLTGTGVSNVLSLTPQAAGGFPEAIPCNEYPVNIGDTYEDGRFYRNGELLKSYSELYAEANEILSIIYDGVPEDEEVNET